MAHIHKSITNSSFKIINISFKNLSLTNLNLNIMFLVLVFWIALIYFAKNTPLFDKLVPYSQFILD